MWNPFRLTRLELGQAVAPAEPGTGGVDAVPEPTIPDLDDPVYPASTLLGSAGTVSEYVGAVDDRPENQHVHPADVGALDYRPRSYSPGQGQDYAYLSPAPGSEDLTAPRWAGGIPGSQRIPYSADGPVTGDANAYYNVRAALSMRAPGASGPVTGGMDYNQSLARAYFQQEAAAFAQAAAESAMVAAL